MVEVLLDGNRMNTRGIAHSYLKCKFKLPEYYGNNLDALWDILVSYSESIKIQLKNEEKLIENLGEYGRAIIQVFQDAQEDNENILFEII